MLAVPKWYGVTNNNMLCPSRGNGPTSWIRPLRAIILKPSSSGARQLSPLPGTVASRQLPSVAFRTAPGGRRRLPFPLVNTWYVSLKTNREIVQPEQVEEILPGKLNQPDVQPTERYITLTTCHGSTAGEFGNDQRTSTRSLPR